MKMKARPNSTLGLPSPKQLLVWEPGDWQYQKFLDRGIIFLQGEIDDDLSSEFTFQLIHLTKIEPPMEGGQRKPIWIILDSCGGDVFAGLGIFDTIRAAVASGAEINILGKGLVASMATAVLQAGSKRFVLPHTQFLVHEISQSIFDMIEKVSVGEERVEEGKRINFVVMSIIAERAGISVEELIKFSKKKDCWYDVQSALKIGSRGLADEVVISLPF